MYLSPGSKKTSALSIGGDAINFAVWRTAGIQRTIASYGQRRDIQFGGVIKQRATAIGADPKNLAIMARAEIDISLTIDGAGPYKSLLSVEYFSNVGASVSTPVSLIEMPRASPFKSSARLPISQITG